MKKTRLIFVICALTAAVWSLPGLAQAKHSPGTKNSDANAMKVTSMFDGGAAHTSSMFDGGSMFDGH